MDSKYFGLNELIGRVVKAPGDQGRIVAVAMAMAVVAKAPLPSSPVDNMADYYAMNVHQDAAKIISEINESVIFASHTALECVNTFWKLRYYAAHPVTLWVNWKNAYYNPARAADGSSLENMDTFTTFIGGAREISPDLMTFMNKYKCEIMDLTGFIISLVNEPIQVAEVV